MPKIPKNSKIYPSNVIKNLVKYCAKKRADTLEKQPGTSISAKRAPLTSMIIFSPMISRKK